MKKKKLDLLYEDKNLLIVSKPSKLLTVGTEKEKNHTLYQEVSAYVKKQHPKNKVFIVNRLDKDTSGIVLFAKDERLKKEIQNHWADWAKNREYIAVVEGKMEKKAGTIKNYLYEDKRLYVHETTDASKGVLAITHYEVLKQTNKYSLLKIRIETGRKNQIRVHLKGLHHPIIGDKKYGSLKNPLGRLGLHAVKLDLIVPPIKKELHIQTKIPGEFLKMFEESN